MLKLTTALEPVLSVLKLSLNSSLLVWLSTETVTLSKVLSSELTTLSLAVRSVSATTERALTLTELLLLSWLPSCYLELEATTRGPLWRVRTERVWGDRHMAIGNIHNTNVDMNN